MLLIASGCEYREAITKAETSGQNTESPEAAPSASPAVPNLQEALLDDRFRTTTSPFSEFDFKTHTFPLPRGWQHQDGDEITLINGKAEPTFKDIDEEMSPEEKAEARSERRIGMSYFTTRYLDVDGDGTDEAAVILKVVTGGSAVPLLVYVYKWTQSAPELIWHFRTGDRADGGLKDLRMEHGELIVELYGQDRFLLQETETGKITGDEEQICCPTFFTRTFYKWNGTDFRMQGKRLTFKMDDPATPFAENFGEIMNDPVKSKKYLEDPNNFKLTPKDNIKSTNKR